MSKSKKVSRVQASKRARDNEGTMRMILDPRGGKRGQVPSGEERAERRAGKHRDRRYDDWM